MADLSQLSLQRAGLPTFPGASLREQLVNGRDSALAILHKYRPALSYDAAAASDVMRQISVWEERNGALLEQAISDPKSEALPDQVRLAFGSDKAQAFIIAGFTQAAIGLGPWMSGAVERAANASQPGDTLQPRWAMEDAEARLQVFGSILKMENDGYLNKLFVHPDQMMSGLGFLPIAIEGTTVIWALVVTLVAVAALVIGYLYLSKTLEANNRLMTDLCNKAQKDGDQATVDSCVREAAGLQRIPGLEALARAVGTVIVVGGLVYIALWAAPKALEIRKAAK